MKNARTRSSVAALGVSLLLLIAPSVAHSSSVMGSIHTDTRWTTAGSPYQLAGDVTVEAGVTLTIDPGVTVVAAGTDVMGSGADKTKVELIVAGALIANGTSSQPIVFRGDTTGPDGWYGITLTQSAGASQVTFAKISDASLGISVQSGSPIGLSDLAISDCNTGLLWNTSAAGTVQRTTFTRFATSGVTVGDGSTAAAVAISECNVSGAVGAGIVVRPKANATVKRSDIVANATGLLVQAGGAVRAESNVVALNSLVGLDLTQAGTSSIAVVNSTIDTNVAAPPSATSAGTGVAVRAVTSPDAFIVRNCIITNHGTAGLAVGSAASPSLDHNDVWNNGTDYQGMTAGASSLSINPLFSQAASTDPSGAWTFVSAPVTVSVPPSFDNSAKPWSYRQIGATALRLRFTAISVMSGAGALFVTDSAGAPIGTYSVNVQNITTDPASGGFIAFYGKTNAAFSGGFSLAGYEYTSPVYDYHLQPTSPCIDKGNNIDAALDDRDGIARPYDGNSDGTATVDIGAYEWHQNRPPVANAGPNRTVSPGSTVSFDSAGSHDPDGKIESYSWNFGDESTDTTGPQTSHVYASTGVYTATLSVTDDLGATGTATCTVRVVTNLPPVADAGADQFVNLGETATLDGGASTDPDGTITSYSWDFGDGTAVGTGVKVIHGYAKAGVYTVTLTVTDDRGAATQATTHVVAGAPLKTAPPVAVAGGPYAGNAGDSIAIDGSASTDPDGSIGSFAWSFGDGTTGSGAKITHSYAAAGTYLLKLTVTDNGGASASDATLVTIASHPDLIPDNKPPVARAGGKLSAKTGKVVNFDGSGSSDPDGVIASYDWDFGDGTAHGSSATTTHVYTEAGTYLVRLSVMDDRGASSSDVALATIVESPASGNDAGVASTNHPLTADAGGPYAAVIQQAITFNAGAAADPSGHIVSYAWAFGDGTTGTGVTTSHAYDQTGAYLVKLMVTDDRGETEEAFALANVTDGSAKKGGCSVSIGSDSSGSAMWLLIGLALLARRKAIAGRLKFETHP